MQKKSEFDLLSFATHLRFCLILVRICSYKEEYIQAGATIHVL